MRGPCEICGAFTELDRDHIKTKGSGGRDDESNIWLICRSCHIAKHRNGLSWIIEKYPHTEKILLDKGWKMVNIFGRWKLTRESNDS